ncbi:ABATE domain-containing protein [Streptomyces caelestis]|nr:ABATE domain-containing protein [Streptomyces sp. XY152]
MSGMRDSTTRDTCLVLDLALIIRHDGSGEVVDDLAEPGGLTGRVRAHPEAPAGAERHVADADGLVVVREPRAASREPRTAVRPAEPSPADATRLLPLPEAPRRLNDAAARTPTVPVLEWAEGHGPVVRRRPVPDGGHDLAAVLARAAIAFLTSPDRERLYACHAPAACATS